MNKEVKRLNQRGGRILRNAGFVFEEWQDHRWIAKETNNVGYADYYLVKCWNNSKMINEADAFVYHQLVDIDSKLGTSASLQLLYCLCWTNRWEIIKVNFDLKYRFRKISRLSTLKW